MKRLTCMVAALATVMSAYPVQAEYIGTLPKDQDWSVVVQNQGADDATLTIYYLGNNLDVIGFMTVPLLSTGTETFPKPGNRVKRIIIEVDPALGGRAVVTVGNLNSLNCDEDKRLVFNVV
jgi:hypothetical protein